MNRPSVLKRLKEQAKLQALPFSTKDGARHTLVTVGNTTRTLGRHKEVPDGTSRSFYLVP